MNPNDEESLKRIINYPSRGIGMTTIDKLIIASKENELSIFNILENLSTIKLNINLSTYEKLTNFLNLLKSFKIENSNLNAFEITDLVIKKTGILNNLKSDGVPENISKIENIEELLNGIKTFTEEQNDLLTKSNKLSEFLEDVALATDFDNEKKIHQTGYH